jgi:hypothetical protein
VRCSVNEKWKTNYRGTGIDNEGVSCLFVERKVDQEGNRIATSIYPRCYTVCLCANCRVLDITVVIQDIYRIDCKNC